VACEWSTKQFETTHHSRSVVRSRSDEDVEITRRPGNTVDGHGMCANDDETNARFLERAEEVLEVVVEGGRGQRAPDERETLPGALRRS
jgi:hypothetical protein